MKSTGIVRKVDTLGRIVIPKELCRKYRMEPGTPVEIMTDDTGCVILRRYTAVDDAISLLNSLKKLVHDDPDMVNRPRVLAKIGELSAALASEV